MMITKSCQEATSQTQTIAMQITNSAAIQSIHLDPPDINGAWNIITLSMLYNIKEHSATSTDVPHPNNSFAMVNLHFLVPP
mmetsp:Transcript_24780/g.36037  ORF Transcript_24780/g.36037 Transcript_24780/m.36037 type:complete len:81 (+) Transcript_24780:191-433(+)|eukprot:2395260-Ditylum_brightwellii.AAC.1